MDLIITGGNISFFNYLKVFVETLRKNACFDGEVVICDNSVFKIKNRVKLIKGQSFTDKQMSFFKDYDVKIIKYSDLLNSMGVSRSLVENIPSSHAAYPHKFIYTALISKMFFGKIERACFFDADCFFQNRLDDVLNSISPKGILLSEERLNIKDNEVMRSWVQTSSFSFGGNQEHFIENMLQKPNYCTGFIGATVEELNKFSVLCWTLALNSKVSFHNDQPLANILVSYFGSAFETLPFGKVLHLCDVDVEKLKVKECNGRLQVCYDAGVPDVIHFNGGSRDDMKTFMQYYYPDGVGGASLKPSFQEMLKFRLMRKPRKGR